VHELLKRCSENVDSEVVLYEDIKKLYCTMRLAESESSTSYTWLSLLSDESAKAGGRPAAVHSAWEVSTIRQVSNRRKPKSISPKR